MFPNDYALSTGSIVFSPLVPLVPLVLASWYAVRGSDPAIRGNGNFMFKLSWYGAEGAEKN